MGHQPLASQYLALIQSGLGGFGSTLSAGDLPHTHICTRARNLGAAPVLLLLLPVLPSPYTAAEWHTWKLPSPSAAFH